MNSLVSAQGLTKAYRGKPAIVDIDIAVAKGETFGILGANGAGKTTTIECLLGVCKPDAGSVLLRGMNPRKDRHRVFEKVGVQFQEARYQSKITVSELCRATRSPYRTSEDPAWLLDRFGLADKGKQPVESLSGGQR